MINSQLLLKYNKYEKPNQKFYKTHCNNKTKIKRITKNIE